MNINKISKLVFSLFLVPIISLFLSSSAHAWNNTGELSIPELNAKLTVKAYLNGFDNESFQVSADYKSYSDNAAYKTPEWIKVEWSFEVTRLNFSGCISGVSVGTANSELGSKGGSWLNNWNTHSSHKGKISKPNGVAAVRLTAKASFLCSGVCRSVETSAG